MSHFMDDRPWSRGWTEATDGPSLEEGRQLVDELVRVCAPSRDELHCAVNSLVRNNMLAMAQHLAGRRAARLGLAVHVVQAALRPAG